MTISDNSGLDKCKHHCLPSACTRWPQEDSLGLLVNLHDHLVKAPVHEAFSLIFLFHEPKRPNSTRGHQE